MMCKPEIININIPINPVPASRPRVGRYGTYYAQKYQDFRVLLKDYLNIFHKNKNCEKTIAVEIVSIIFYIKMPESWSLKKKKTMNFSRHTSKPDIDNLEKALFDGLNGIVFKDDSQVHKKNDIYKRWSFNGSICTELKLDYE